MLKKRKHKVKRRNTEPHMQLGLNPGTGSGGAAGGCSSPAAQATPVLPYSAPHNKQTPLVDLCDSPTHATPV